MVTLTIELITWGLYFFAGIVLLFILMFARRSEKNAAKNIQNVNKTIQRFRFNKEMCSGRGDNFKRNYYK